MKRFWAPTSTTASNTPTLVSGAPNAPDVTETLTNAGINVAAVAILGTVVYRDVQGAKRDRQLVEREETLATLQVCRLRACRLLACRLQAQAYAMQLHSTHHPAHNHTISMPCHHSHRTPHSG